MNFRLFFFLALPFLSGCFSSKNFLLPKDVRTIHIGYFQNETFSLRTDNCVFAKNLDVIFMEKLENVFLYDGRLGLVTDPDSADWTIKGAVKRYVLIPLSYSKRDAFEVEEFRVILTVSLTLIDNASKKLLWSDHEFKCSYDFFFDRAKTYSQRAVLDKISSKMAHNILIALFEGWYR